MHPDLDHHYNENRKRPINSSSFPQRQTDFTPEFLPCSSLRHTLPITCCPPTYLWVSIRMEAPWGGLFGALYPQCLEWHLRHRAHLINVVLKSNKWIWKVLTTVVLAIQRLLRREMCTFFLPLREAEKMLQWPSVPEAVNQQFVLTACLPNSDFVWENKWVGEPCFSVNSNPKAHW